MWLITVFEKARVRIFEYQSKKEAVLALEKFKGDALLTYTN